ncbi:hypothetical protein Q4Q34_07750 [Flavivirga abyssicola]|uniref:hypothetical protein n=1 Tax=Flavivirga abyssicola TaxID=3063533 RepID=UPI0026DEA750|nr:hypothetical protein [Flavivirga sp. MEBiC07777]WVK14919.1 hypothetical protein Q4Q34_07750 [Flavivirga sp. MEBiC07777]
MKNTTFRKRVPLVFIIPMLILFIKTTNAQGPNTPEAASFEPVDATDMVNLVTGDLSYVLPLLNVPSPEGGYPIALSYHAGIAMEQEATWVGLGWNINPGAINRSVNGYPDDWNNRKKTSIMYDIGGTYTSHDFHSSIGWKKGKYSVGLYASYGVNRAFGGETTYDMNFGGSFGIGNDKKMKANVHKFNVGTNGIGYSYKSFNKKGIYLGTSSIGFNGNDGISLGANGKSGGITLSSNGNHYISSSKGSGQISGSGSFSSKLHTRTVGTVIIVDINAGLFSSGYSKKKQRYSWYDRASYDCLGALYLGQTDEMISNSLHSPNASVDSYESIYKTYNNQQLLENNFSGISYDNYIVSSQGLTGSMTPYLFEQGTFKNRYNRISTSIDNKYATESTFSYYDNSFTKQIDDPNNDINFHFDNTNASYMSLSSGLWGNLPSSINEITDVVINSKITDHTTIIDNISLSNYNPAKNRIINGPFVEVFTNGEIVNNIGNIIDVNSLNRSSLPQDGIGAYKITNADGLVYHYSLPVYQKEMFSRSTELDNNIEDKFYEEQQFTPYATHWLLTAITGPDYVDNNTNGKVDENDYGYWIEFEYGKWSDGYAWRSPTKKLAYHENETTKSFGWGIKEIYYLDMIKSRTHTALFIKESRLDNYGSEINIGTSQVAPKVYNYGAKTILGLSDSNYFVKGIYDNRAVNLAVGVYYSNIWHKEYVSIDKHKSLRLKEILLLKNEDVPLNVKTYLGESNGRKIGEMYFEEEVRVYDTSERQVYHANYPMFGNNGLREWNGEFYNNVLDSDDISTNISNINNLKVNHIYFNYDEEYPLMSNSPNSFPSGKGKLTLKNVYNKTRSIVNLIPPYEFSYISNSNYDRDKEDPWGYTKWSPQNSSLNQIKTPTGAKIKIDYEPDDYYKEAANVYRTYDKGLEFNFYEFNGKLRFDVKNEPNTDNYTYFEDYFEVGTPVEVDIWACIKHEYHEVIGGCKSRDGSIDLEDVFVDVVSVSSSTVVFETNLSYTTNYNDGLNWLYGASPMGFDYSNYIMQNQRLRSQCPILDGGCSDRTRVVFKYNIKALDSKRNEKGGGLRVAKITINEGFKNYSTQYSYNLLGYNSNPHNVNYRSSGVTSYSPSKFNKEVEYITEIPTPNVYYEYVRVEEKDINNSTNTSKLYNFEVLKPSQAIGSELSFGEILKIKKTQNDDGNTIHLVDGVNAKVSRYKYEVFDNKSALGRLLNLTSFNSKGQIISKVNNNYKKLNELNQGIIQETFYSYTRASSNLYNEAKYHLNASSKTTYPSVLNNTVTIQDGFKVNSVFSKHDFNTGQVLETVTTDSKGNEFKTELIPAYTISDYSGDLNNNGIPDDYSMGSKVDDPTNKNMLTQEAITKTYIKVGNDWKETGVGITTWNNDWSYTDYAGTTTQETVADKKIWRKHKTFVWDGGLNLDGTYLGFTGDDDSFDWTVNPTLEQPNTKWKNISTTTQYDHYSMPLEVKDINDNYTATKMCDSDSKVLAVSNAAHTEMYYSGAEYIAKDASGNDTAYFDGQVKASVQSSTYAHTGFYSIIINTNIKGFEVNLPNNNERTGVKSKFKISVWARIENYINARIHINGLPKAFNGEKVFAGDWVQLNHYEELSTGEESVYVTSAAGKIRFDDFRLYPATSSMTSYVYNEWDELWYIISNNGLSSKFEYDAAGRLIKTYSEVIDDGSLTGGFKQVGENSYNYKKPL